MSSSINSNGLISFNHLRRKIPHRYIAISIPVVLRLQNKQAGYRADTHGHAIEIQLKNLRKSVYPSLANSHVETGCLRKQ